MKNFNFRIIQNKCWLVFTYNRINSCNELFKTNFSPQTCHLLKVIDFWTRQSVAFFISWSLWPINKKTPFSDWKYGGCSFYDYIHYFPIKRAIISILISNRFHHIKLYAAFYVQRMMFGKVLMLVIVFLVPKEITENRY